MPIFVAPATVGKVKEVLAAAGIIFFAPGEVAGEPSGEATDTGATGEGQPSPAAGPAKSKPTTPNRTPRPGARPKKRKR